MTCILMMHKLPTIVLAAAILICAGSTRAGNLSPVGPRCEYRVNPLGIDESEPRLTWRVESDGRGQKQTAYRVLVASSAELLAKDSGDLWDSGKVPGDDTINVPYGGKTLVPREVCFWKVCVWDKDGVVKWSEPASWTMGLLGVSDWNAKYITARDESPVWSSSDSELPSPLAVTFTMASPPVMHTASPGQRESPVTPSKRSVTPRP